MIDILAPVPSAIAPRGFGMDEMGDPINGFDARDIAHVAESEVVTFINRMLTDECGMHVRRHLESSVARYFERFDPKNRLFTALYRNNALHALLAVDYLNDATGVLKWIFVAPEDRNRGFGSRLIDRAIDFARSVGYKTLILCTSAEMKAAHHLYRKKGFAFKQNVTFWRKPMTILERTL